MDESDISEKAKKARRVLNQNTIKTIQDNSMKGFLVRWPSAFDNMLDYRTWEQMKSYIEKETLKTNNKDGDNE